MFLRLVQELRSVSFILWFKKSTTMYHLKFRRTFFALTSSIVIIITSIVPIAFAQPNIEPPAELNGASEDNLKLNATGTDIPLIEKISQKGIYKVQLRWPQVPLNPQDAFQIQLFFLNATAPTASLPRAETNFTGSGSESAFTVPDIVASLLPIESYDITIYSQDGAILWQKLNEPGYGGRPGQRIVLENQYTGPVTIEVTNIRPGWNIDDGSSASAEDMIDSVKFEASIVS